MPRGENSSRQLAQQKIGPSVMDVAARSGLLALSPSDLVFESSQYGVAYYDFVLSISDIRESDSTPTATICNLNGGGEFEFEATVLPSTSAMAGATHYEDVILPATTVDGGDSIPATKGYQLFLAKLDPQTNVEWFETVRVPAALLAKNGIPTTELAMITMGVLIWRNTLSKSRLLCLVNQLNDDNSIALEALKRATNKFKCIHHVLTIGARRASSTSTNSSCSSCSYRSSISSNSSQEGMKLRVMMCQSRNELTELPAQAVRETKFLLAPSSNPLLCLCFPLT